VHAVARQEVEPVAQHRQPFQGGHLVNEQQQAVQVARLPLGAVVQHLSHEEPRQRAQPVLVTEGDGQVESQRPAALPQVPEGAAAGGRRPVHHGPLTGTEHSRVA
jgi:hypothetical protein